MAATAVIATRQVYPRIDYRTITGVEAAWETVQRCDIAAVEDETCDPATLPKFNMNPWPYDPEKERIVFQPAFFRAMSVELRGCNMV